MEWRRFPALGVDLLYDLLALRCAVFVVEQASAYLDVDGRDRDAAHLLAFAPAPDGRDALAGALRMTGPDATGHAALGRIVTAPWARRGGLGTRLIVEGLARLDAEHPDAPARLSAQGHLTAYYARFGFRVTSPEYDDGGVPHHDMARPAQGGSAART
jgi:ElaA protein